MTNHKRYLRKVAEIGFDVLKFQAHPLLDMTKDNLIKLKRTTVGYNEVGRDIKVWYNFIIHHGAEAIKAIVTENKKFTSSL